MAKKRKGKYPNLDKSQNTKSRSDYIETEYVDGIKNHNGRVVIRPLNVEEKEWLNKYYGEFVAFSDRQLNPTEEILQYMKQKSDLKKEIAKIKREEKVKTNCHIQHLKRKIEEVESALDFLRKEAGVFNSTCEEQRKLYSVNNSRNFCVYNNRKARGMLLELTTETYDTFLANIWDSLASFDYDSQDVIIDIVEERLRKDGFLGDDCYSEDFSDSGSDSDAHGDKS